eukprot:424509-Prymnesium_polylepis.1
MHALGMYPGTCQSQAATLVLELVNMPTPERDWPKLVQTKVFLNTIHIAYSTPAKRSHLSQNDLAPER